MLDLDNEDGDLGEEVEFKINEDYASKYDSWREKEEYQKLKARCGSDVEDSSSSSEDDTEDEILQNEFDKDFMKLLSCMKKKDPKIYDEKVSFVENFTNKDSEEGKRKTRSDKKKPIFTKDYNRHLIETKTGESTDDDEDENLFQKKRKNLGPTIAEELEEIKESFKTAQTGSDDEEDDYLLSKREPSKEETEEPDFWKWLKGKTNDIKDEETKREMEGLHDCWNNSELDDEEKFLKDFMLNKRYLDRNNDGRTPSYNEMVHDAVPLNEEDELSEMQTKFEREYNFRYQEPDTEFIKQYPRLLPNTLRKQDDRRKIKRAETRDRKIEEKQRKTEELKQLKALKRKEIMEKLEQLQEITGCTVDDNGEFFNDADLEGDFDPEEHERKMNAIFNDDYYDHDEELQKPAFEDNDYEEPIENWDTWTRDKSKDQHELHCEDPDFNMDADYDPTSERKQEMLESSQSRKKRRKSKFLEVLQNKKRIFDPTKDKSFEKYIDEYYKLDYEDIIGGDLPCRFKYRKVVPNDFGLSLDEILEADDRELNKWCSLKKTTQYRREEDEVYDVQAFKKKAVNFERKKFVLASVYMKNEDENDETQEAGTKKRRKRKKKNANQLTMDDSMNGSIEKSDSQAVKNLSNERSPVANEQIEKVEGESKRAKKRKRKNKNKTSAETDSSAPASQSTHKLENPKINGKKRKTFHETGKSNKDGGVEALTDDRLRAYGINPKKFKNKLKYGKNRNE